MVAMAEELECSSAPNVVAGGALTKAGMETRKRRVMTKPSVQEGTLFARPITSPSATHSRLVFPIWRCASS